MSEWELTDEELWQEMLEALKRTDPTHRQEIQDSQILNRAIAKAQVKKLVDYLNKRAFYFQPEGEGAVIIISCDWQALLEEVKNG